MTRLLISCLMFTMATPVSATVHVVDPGGEGDHKTIGAAISAAVAGDRIEVQPGRYAESCTLTVALELVGVGGSGVTALDGEGERLILWLKGAGPCTISGFSFIGGHHDSGAAIHASDAAVARVSECVFKGNRATWDGGAVYTCMAGTRLQFSDCRFQDNHAHSNGGAMGINTSSYIEIWDCVFRDNTSATRGGAVGVHAQAYAVITTSLFVDNAGYDAGALRAQYATVHVMDSTFHENVAPAGYSVRLMEPGAVFERNIVSNVSETRCISAPGNHDFNVFYDGYGVPDPGTHLAPHEVYQDPGYCDFTTGNFTLCADSPALPRNNGFCLIGAFDKGCTGCGPVATEETSWGHLKALFRGKPIASDE